MEENIEMPCSSKSIPSTKVLAVILFRRVEIHDLKNKMEENFGKVLKIKVLKINVDDKKCAAHITFEKPESADSAIQAKTITLYGSLPVHIFPVHDEHQDIEFDNPIYCSDGHIHYLPLHLSVEQDRNFLDEAEDQCSNENDCMMESLENVGSTDECKITILNDDCLRHIFSFLDKKELIKIERVCKWWQSVSLSCWPSFKEITEKNIRPKYFVERAEFLRCVLKRCGKYVRKLDTITGHGVDNAIVLSLNCNYKSVDYIAEYCSSLRELYLREFHMCPVSCRALSNAVKQLEILHISYCVGLTDETLGRLLSKCPNLRELSVTLVYNFSAKCLNSLNPNTMEKIIISKQDPMKIDELVPALKMLKKLKCLDIDGLLDVRCAKEFSCFTEAVQQNLEHFVYKNNDHVFDIANCNKSFGNLVNLTYLNVDQNILITNEVLLEIIRNCVNIKRLVLSGCGQGATVTDFGVKKLVNLHQLQDLSLSYLQYVTDQSLHALALAGRLIKLEIRGNTNITNVGCGKIVSLCKDLEYFDIRDCVGVTDSTLRSAEAAVQSRTTDITLNLIVGD